MKTIKLLLCLSITASATGQQTNSCTVAVEAISGQYTGDCDKKKAHGVGKAIGVDTYEGEFKKGYPDGMGTYIWPNGNFYTGNFKKGLKHGKGTMHYKLSDGADSTVMGFWKKDIYAGRYENPYEFFAEGQASLLNKRITKQGNKRNVIRFIANSDRIKNFILKDGTYTRINQAGGGSNYFIEFYDVRFPFRIEFGAIRDAIDFVIYEEGDWEVDLTFSM